MDTKEKIMDWNKQDITVLRDLIAEQNKILANSEVPELEEVDLSDLPSAVEVPEIISDYPVWAIDVKGRALVGAGLDEIESLSKVLEWYAADTTPHQEFHVKGYEQVEKFVTPGSKTSSRVYVPKGWEGKRVLVIRLNP